MRDLTAANADQVRAERARVATEGARPLALQAPDGRWGGAAWNRGWDSTMHVLSLLREMGLDPASVEARRAVGLVRDRVTWRGCDPREADDHDRALPAASPSVGALGNVAITSTFLANPQLTGFTIFGMAGGAGNDCLSGTECKVDDDCKFSCSSLVCTGS